MSVVLQESNWLPLSQVGVALEYVICLGDVGVLLGFFADYTFYLSFLWVLYVS